MTELHDVFDRYPITPNEVLGQADFKNYASGSAKYLNDIGILLDKVLGQADFKDWAMRPHSFAPAQPMGLPPRNPYLC